MEEVDREISEMKLSLNARARIVAESYLTAVRSFRLCPLPVLIFDSLIHDYYRAPSSVLKYNIRLMLRYTADGHKDLDKKHNSWTSFSPN
jgi:hypothetical protein